MYPGTQPDLFEKWLPRRSALQAAFGIWAAGFAVAGATAWCMHHQTASTDETKGTAVEVAATPTEISSGNPASEGAVQMPIDVIVGLRKPKIGVALSQKP
jgi:hypothetical protein